MNIRLKTLLIVGFTLISVVVVVSIVSIALMLQGFDQIEQDLMQENVHRAFESINVEKNNLNVKLGDWAMWDDTYAFVADGNPAYIESNLTDNALETLQINSMVFVNQEGKVVYEKTLLPQGFNLATSSSSLARHLASGSALLDFASIDDFHAGLLSLPEGPMLVATRPILTSMNEGPSHGTLVFGKYVDANMLGYLRQTTRLPVTFSTLEEAQLHKDTSAVIRQTQGSSVDHVVRTLNEDAIAGYGILPDIYGNSMFIIRIELPRNIYHQALGASNRLLFFSAIGIVLFLLFLAFLLEKNVFSRITKLIHSVSLIGKSGNLAARLPEDKRADEISLLSYDINAMLSSLESSRHALSEEKSKSQQYIDVVRLMIVVINADQTIRMVNKFMCEVLGYSEQELVGKNWFDMCILPEDREQVHSLFIKIMKGENAPVLYHENTILAKDGTRRVVAWHNAVLKDQEQKVYATLSAGEDITKRSESEKLLRENEERYRIAAQQTGQLIYDYDISSGHISWAGAIKEVTGYEYDEFRLIDIHGWEEHIHPEDRDAALAELEKNKTFKGTYHVEYRFRKKDGSYCLIEDRGLYLPNEKGEIARMIGAMEDISKEKEEESALRVRTEELERINASMVGRELRMAEMKKEIEALKQRV